MKRYAAATLLAAAALMVGCDMQGTSSRPSNDRSTPIIINTTSEPSLSSDVQANAPARSDTFISEKRTVAAGETLTVKNGETLYIKDGAELTVDGALNCENGGAIKLQSGGSLLLNGKMTLDGSMELGGSLGIREKGEINGAGTLSVLNSFDDINCEGACKARIKAPAPVEKDGVTYVGGVLIVNKKYSVPEEYGAELGLVIDEAYDTLLQMREDSGYGLPLVSGYRSYELQTELFDYYCEVDGYERASMYSAEPGHSEHQTGLAMDIGELSEYYAETEEGGWLTENCCKYGFIIRYPKGSEVKTGYDYEPWHIRWLGKSTAKLVCDSGLTLEEFLGVEAV
ncbi:MAG: M15 family metallopeptidase [Lachnospiraceae bacterium]|nr:M15 family metallopeptidase [Ruminococcus sp.]MCM1274676.1 M15 family metallopeptidase [Lachnospiraceae bacterium]